VGQVESDASIRFGSPVVQSNLELLKRVRAANPEAYVLYKPHPDVVAGMREPGSNEAAAAQYCDEVLTEADPNRLLAQVDEVHTMTSLLGFEALLRGVPVTCHGLPFYAGWGLTEDRATCDRRGRKVTLDELVHAALVDYPLYVSPRSGRLVRPEEILAELAGRKPPGPIERRLRRWFLLGWRRLSGRG
jgi:capsular polysaccharide export protein